MGITNMIQSISIPLAKATLSPGLLLLHATHLFLLILTLLFLVLPAISGPGTNIWWMTITLPTPSSTTGSVWNLGGLGACKVGDICDATTAAGENVPVMAGQVKSTLMYHLAGMSFPLTLPLMAGMEGWMRGMLKLITVVAGISTLMALVEYGPGPGPSAICAGWTATYLLVAVPVLVSTPMIVDLVVRSKILKDENIDSVVIGGVFWL